MNISILYFDNMVGIRRDANLLLELLKVNNNVKLTTINEKIDIFKNDIGIWLQTYIPNKLSNFKKNILYVNEEWIVKKDLEYLYLIDYIIVKSKYAKELLHPYHKNIINIGFFSKNIYNPEIKTINKFIHFAGKSIQKNTEMVINTFKTSTQPLTIMYSIDKWEYGKSYSNIKCYDYYLNDVIVFLELNMNNIHICPSLYESWGHYMYEGLSTGNEIICSSIPVFIENIDPDLVYFLPLIKDNKMEYEYINISKEFPLRKWFISDNNYLTQLIENFIPIGKNKERRLLFNYINDRNKNNTLNFFKNI